METVTCRPWLAEAQAKVGAEKSMAKRFISTRADMARMRTSNIRPKWLEVGMGIGIEKFVLLRLT